MRKYLIVAAAAGGLLLLGGAPAYADDNPAPAGLVGGLDPAGGLSLDSPLGDSPLVDVKPGKNSVPAAPQTPSVRSLPTVPSSATGVSSSENDLPGARTGLGGAAPDLPAAEVVGGALPQSGGGPLGALPVGNLLGGGRSLIGGLLPNGQVPLAPATARESGLLGEGAPLLGGLGGLGGLLPPSTGAADRDVTGMPAGGTAVDPPATGPAPASPATAAPAGAGPGDDRKRLHEEPIDNEASGGRTFSDGRPVAGTDPDYQ